MRNIWIIALREFLHRVKSRGFLISSFAVPFLIIVVWAVTGVFDLTEGGEYEQDVFELKSGGPTGYVDRANFIQRIPPDLPGDLLRAYPDVDAANQALRSGEIDAYYLLAEGYVETGEIQHISLQLPSGPPNTEIFTQLLVYNLLPGAGPEEIARIHDPLAPAGLRFVSTGIEEDGSGGGFNFSPFLVTFVIIMPLFTGGGYLLQSLAQEKSNRVIEILLVSLQPKQLLAGKLTGIGALTLVQYLLWFAVVGMALLVIGESPAAILGGVNLSVQEILYALLFALGGYVLYASFMAGLGALAPNMEGGRSWVLVISLPMMIPIYMWTAIVQAPQGPLAVAVSLIPFTSPVGMLMRLTSTTVPFWQIGASLGLLALTSLGIIWLMARLFQVRTLLSGEAISVKRIWSALRG